MVEGTALALLGALIAVIGYFAMDVHDRLKEIAQSLASIEVSWTRRLGEMDNRVTSLETRMAIYHGDHVHPPELTKGS